MANEYISRDEALKIIDQHCFETSYDAKYMDDELNDLPAADVIPLAWIMSQVDHGKWDMPLFKGTVQDARQDTDRVWYYLMCEVDHYECTNGILDIRVRDEYYSERLEGHYSISSDRWGESKDKRPWRHSFEIDKEKRGGEDG